MNTSEWSAIPTKLNAKGFSVFYDRVSYEPKRPLWCAKANRDGRHWTTLGENLSAALVELEREIDKPGEFWDDMLGDDCMDAGRALRQSAFPPTQTA
jgi:hypothetical protein